MVVVVVGAGKDRRVTGDERGGGCRIVWVKVDGWGGGSMLGGGGVRGGRKPNPFAPPPPIKSPPSNIFGCVRIFSPKNKTTDGMYIIFLYLSSFFFFFVLVVVFFSYIVNPFPYPHAHLHTQTQTQTPCSPYSNTLPSPSQTESNPSTLLHFFCVCSDGRVLHYLLRSQEIFLFFSFLFFSFVEGGGERREIKVGKRGEAKGVKGRGGKSSCTCTSLGEASKGWRRGGRGGGGRVQSVLPAQPYPRHPTPTSPPFLCVCVCWCCFF